MKRLSLSVVTFIAAILPTLAACDNTPPVTFSPATTLAQSIVPLDDEKVYERSYLSLDFKPTTALANRAEAIRKELGFVDMGKAIPPRDTTEMHVTVGFFEKLTEEQANLLAQHFQKKHFDLTISGYGVANNQVAFYTVNSIGKSREVMKELGVTFTADDPHVTFGVNPANPRDVHNVPKKPLAKVGPYRVRAHFQLRHGKNIIW